MHIRMCMLVCVEDADIMGRSLVKASGYTIVSIRNMSDRPLRVPS